VINAFREGRIVGPAGQLKPSACVLTRRSVLLMTPRSVLKLRRPVTLEDNRNTTRAGRIADSEQELWIGRRASPGLYLGDCGIRLHPEGATLVSGIDPALEPVVAMLRLPDAQCAREVLRDCGDPTARLRPLMLRIAAFHADAPLHRAHDGYGAPGRIAKRWQALVSSLPDPILGPDARNALIEQTGGWLTELEGTFAHRVMEGRLRHIHGGLRLEHIFLDVTIHGSDETVAIIDPCEAGEDAHFTDTAEDVALLAVDLDAHGHRDVSDAVLDVYAGITGDRTLRSVTPFFKRLQALRRAGEIYADAQADSDAAMRENGEQAARLCVDLAMRYGGLV
jgi:aminoglycoside phosphotransferase family enzyme